jgi:signal transduction histidine kinase
VAGIATWAVSRSITRPLRALTHQATDMANNRLPDAVLDILDTPLGDDVTVPHVEPIAVQTRDEVSDVAEALNTVQDSALELAVEQAVLRRNIADSFVNLGRRNQNLLGRQLDFITELEHNETDPDTLANLFRLDHLATRMRRNAESLLVLAGIDPPRKWAAPVRITDAIRAALGEVEDYQRVTVRQVEPTTILGSAAADLAHLLAELIENALIFSPPDQTVEIRGRAQPAGYTLAIIDSGLGMPPEELARANRRLAGAESFTIAPSKYLGHYVAGNLAARHNINVTLHNSPGHGITATINLPPTLLTTEPTSTTAGGVPADTAPGAPQLSSEFTPGPERGPKPRQVERAERSDHADRPERPARPERVQGLPPVPDPAPLATPLLGDQTSSGLTKRTSQTPAIPTSGRAQPAVPSDDLLETLGKYTTQLHEQLASPQGAAPTVGSPTNLDRGARDQDRGSDRDGDIDGQRDRGLDRRDRDPDAPPALPGRGAGSFGENGGRIPTSGRSGIVDNGLGTDPLADLAAWSESSTSLPPTQPTPAVSPTGLADGPGGPGGHGGPRPGPDGPGGLPRRGTPDYAEARGGPFDAPGRGAGAGATGRGDGPEGPWGPPTGAPAGPGAGDAWGPPTGAPAGPGGPGDPGGPRAGEALPPLAARARDQGAPGAAGVLPGRPHFGDPNDARPQLAARHPDGDGGRPPLGPPPGMPGGAPGGPGARPGAPLDPGTAGQTQGGLARRVRGAQMPTTEPLSLRRGSGGAGNDPRQSRSGQSSSPFSVSPPPATDRIRAGRSSPPEVPASNGDHRAADEVYGFLSSFTAGVQRGLDEARQDPDDRDA